MHKYHAPAILIGCPPCCTSTGLVIAAAGAKVVLDDKLFVIDVGVVKIAEDAVSDGEVTERGVDGATPNPLTVEVTWLCSQNSIAVSK